jgi:hypothetical protein
MNSQRNMALAQQADGMAARAGQRRKGENEGRGPRQGTLFDQTKLGCAEIKGLS